MGGRDGLPGKEKSSGRERIYAGHLEMILLDKVVPP